MKKTLNTVLLGILAGIFIGIGGTCYLMIPNNIVGAFVFSLGLYGITIFGLYLYTGRVGNLPDKGIKYIPSLLLMIIGNFIGTFLVGTAVRNTRIFASMDNISTIAETKLNDGVLSIFILSIFCGILMYSAVKLYAETKNPLGIFICVPAFILCGFEHCIANMYYFTVAGVWSLKTVCYILIMIFGNGVGGVLVPLSLKLINKK